MAQGMLFELLLDHLWMLLFRSSCKDDMACGTRMSARLAGCSMPRHLCLPN
jgi:hypothetical protein